ncbi:hypothetical protein PAHAL_9G518000 [Panicum hallii]|uniref:Uncharacterized protein n=1 Tax=Panicum hallii TaxID=206008 RepID=A0A2S3IRZ8_9POAL|nr:hypothetical protein PAHAL_9G518000 [Panicum hallii]
MDGVKSLLLTLLRCKDKFLIGCLVLQTDSSSISQSRMQNGWCRGEHVNSGFSLVTNDGWNDPVTNQTEM